MQWLTNHSLVAGGAIFPPPGRPCALNLAIIWLAIVTCNLSQMRLFANSNNRIARMNTVQTWLPFLNFYCYWGIFPDQNIIYNMYLLISLSTIFIKSKSSKSGLLEGGPMKRGNAGHVTSRKEDIRPEFQDRCFLECGFPYKFIMFIIQFKFVSISIFEHLNIHFSNHLFNRMCPKYRRGRSFKTWTWILGGEPGHVTCREEDIQPEFQDRRLRTWVPLPNAYLT